ncbi:MULTISPECIES: DsbA family protein [Burkholderiaceae]|uniref:DsbA family oxidoreductase n=1 Tax=Burkholderiaceae TaxID=119060 RepID=UPI00074C09EB|nr:MULTISPECIES: DsbA family protein [Burkholderiaceae]SAL58183.1 DSBA oxidoreductase [Caballeronia peredens]
MATITHWYDLTCPFCYIAQSRNAVLLARGVSLDELPFQAHPEIPVEGMFVGARSGAMYDMLAAEAEQAQLPLSWPDRLPNSRRALAAAEWVRTNHKERFVEYQKALFAAHFARHENLGDDAVLLSHARACHIDDAALKLAMETQTPLDAVSRAEADAQYHGVRGTPAWLVEGRLLQGLRPVEEFERIAASA